MSLRDPVLAEQLDSMVHRHGIARVLWHLNWILAERNRLAREERNDDLARSLRKLATKVYAVAQSASAILPGPFGAGALHRIGTPPEEM